MFTFTVVFNYLGVYEVYIPCLFGSKTRKIVLGLDFGLGLKRLSSFNITVTCLSFIRVKNLCRRSQLLPTFRYWEMLLLTHVVELVDNRSSKQSVSTRADPVARITYTVLVETLNPALSLSL